MHFGNTSIKRFIRRAPHLFILGVLVCADAFAVFFYVDPSTMWLGVLGHFAVCAAAAIYSFALVPQRYLPARLWVGSTVAVLAILLPVIGVFFGFGIALQIHRAHLVNHLPDYYVSLDDMVEIGDEDFYSYGEEVRSLAEIMHSSDIEARRKATLALRSIEPVFAIPMLRKLIQDSDATVRLYALNLLKDITQHFENKAYELQERRETHEASLSELLQLAEYYREQVYVGLAIDDAQRSSLLNKAINALEEAHTREPENFEVLFTLIKYTLANFDTRRARAALEKLSTVPRFANMAYPWMGELLFEEGNFEGLREHLRELPEAQKTNRKICELREFWL